MTGFLDILFAVLTLVLWAAVVFYAVRTWMKINASRTEDQSVPALLWNYRNRLLLLVIFVVVVGMVTGMETAYRPKVTIRPDNAGLNQKLEKVDSAPKPEIAPSPTRNPDETYKKNREENEAARKEFEKLPDRPRR